MMSEEIRFDRITVRITDFSPYSLIFTIDVDGHHNHVAISNGDTRRLIDWLEESITKKSEQSQ